MRSARKAGQRKSPPSSACSLRSRYRIRNTARHRDRLPSRPVQPAAPPPPRIPQALSSADGSRTRKMGRSRTVPPFGNPQPCRTESPAKKNRRGSSSHRRKKPEARDHPTETGDRSARYSCATTYRISRRRDQWRHGRNSGHMVTFSTLVGLFMSRSPSDSKCPSLCRPPLTKKRRPMRTGVLGNQERLGG